MLSPAERRKNSFAKALLPSFGAEMKKYEEIYQLYTSEGYIKELCELYADTFVNDVKKPAVEDVIQVARLYDKIHDNKSADFYLEMLADKKLSGDDKYYYCIEMLKTQSKQNQYSSFSGNTTHSKQKKVFSGNGDKVTELFTANGCKKITGTYTGEGAFVVMLYDEDAHLEGLIFSNSGQYNGEKVFKFIDDKKYMFEISATDGDWTISIE